MASRLNPRTLYAAAHRRMGPVFGVGALVSNGIASAEMVPILGVSRGRVHFKATAAGTLQLQMAAPDGSAVYVSPAAVTVAVVADTDISLDFDPRGEAYLRISFTPTADGAITFCDVSGV